MKKRIVSLCLAVAMVIAMLPVAAMATETDGIGGTCGEGLIWSFDELSGSLSISGTGDMDNYSWSKMYNSLGQSTNVWVTDAPWRNYYSSIKSIVIESNVTSIGKGAFRGCSAVTSVSLSNDVKVLGEYSFTDCNAIKEVIIPENVKVIGNAAFSDCDALEIVSVLGAASIGNFAFSECAKLKSVQLPETLTSIGEYAFRSCEALKKVTIPSTVRTIGTFAFVWCESLDEIYFEGSAPDMDSTILSGLTCNAYYPSNDETWTDEVKQNFGGTITWGVLCDHNWGDWYETKAPTTEEEGEERRDCAKCDRFEIRSLEKLIANATKEGVCGDNLTWILMDGTLTISGSGPMWDFRDINIVVPWAEYRDEITAVILESGVTSVGSEAFSGGFSHITTVSIPEGVESIGSGAFNGCNNLKTLILPESLRSIGFWAFGYSGISELVIPKNVESIEDGAFETCFNLSKILVDDENQHFSSDENGILYNKEKTKLIRVPLALQGSFYVPEGVIEIGYTAFTDSGLSDITLSNTVTTIDMFAFYLCSIRSITFPESVKYIGGCAFQDIFQLLRTIKFEGDCPFIEKDAFNGVNLTAYYPADNRTWTDEVLKNYGDEGTTITWVPYKPEVDDNDTIPEITSGKDVRYLSSWDPESKSVAFGRDIMSMATVADDADTSLVNALNSLQGNYVLVETKEQDGVDELVSILPVESVAAKVEDVSSIFAKITIGGTEYPVSSGDLVSNVDVDDYVLCHIYNGEIIAIEILQELTGKLMGWNKNTQEVSISLDNEPDGSALGYSLSKFADATSVECLNKLSSGNTTIVTPIRFVGDLQGFLYCVEQLHAEIKVYMPYPVGIIEVGEDVEILLDMYLGETTIPVKKGYTVRIDDADVVQEVEYQEPDSWNNTWIYRFKGINLGIAKITFIDNTDSNNQITIPITVGENVNYYKCTSVSPELESVNGIHIANYQCEDNGDGTHTIKFDAYNTYYSYAVVEIYNQEGDLESIKPISARSDASGIKLVQDYLYYGFVEPFDLTTPWYAKKSFSKHTPITLENIPENAKIRITSDGNSSAYVTLYTGVDIFTDVVFAASSLLNGVSIEAKGKTVETLVNTLADKISATMIKKIADKLGMLMLEGSTADITSNVYELLYNEFSQVGIDFGEIIESVLTNYGYAVPDTIVTYFIPAIKVANLIVNAANIGWKITHFSLFALDSGSMEVFIINHNVINHLVNNNVSIQQNSNFDGNTILDAYVVINEDELSGLPSSATNGLVNYNVYNITIRKDGVEVQPNGEIEVRIPIPEGVEGSKCSVHRIEENGEKTLLPTRVEGEHLVFTTTHLSYYIVGKLLRDDPSTEPHIHSYEGGKCKICGQEEPNGIPGDVNNDGKADYSDALQILRASIGLEELTEAQKQVADVTGDGKPDYSDALLILRRSIGLE